MLVFRGSQPSWQCDAIRYSNAVAPKDNASVELQNSLPRAVRHKPSVYKLSKPHWTNWNAEHSNLGPLNSTSAQQFASLPASKGNVIWPACYKAWVGWQNNLSWCTVDGMAVFFDGKGRHGEKRQAWVAFKCQRFFSPSRIAYEASHCPSFQGAISLFFRQ